jgi:hypothetical protein
MLLSLNIRKERAILMKPMLLLQKEIAASRQPLFFAWREKLLDRKTNNDMWLKMRGGLFHLNKDAGRKLITAYRPVWVIGTGRNCFLE